MTVQNWMGLQRRRRMNCKIKCRKGKMMRRLSISRSSRLLQTTYSPIIGICKLFSCNEKQHMPFWLLKDAWLTCNRCPFSVLPTPFWSPIRHLSRTAWQPIDLLLVADLPFARILFICSWFVWNYVKVFHNPFCISDVLNRKGLCIGGGW